MTLKLSPMPDHASGFHPTEKRPQAALGVFDAC